MNIDSEEVSDQESIPSEDDQQKIESKEDAEAGGLGDAEMAGGFAKQRKTSVDSNDSRSDGSLDEKSKLKKEPDQPAKSQVSEAKST